MGLKLYGNFMLNLSKEKRFTVRKAIVHEALEDGIKPVARRWNMSKNTVRSVGKAVSEGRQRRTYGSSEWPQNHPSQNAFRDREPDRCPQERGLLLWR